MRSMLFVPADRPERFEKACASGADGVIVDLEDAVAPQAKAQAREGLAQWLSPQRDVFVRINAPASPWFEADLRLVRLPGVRGVVLPKAERVEDIEAVAAASASGRVLPLIETALGMHLAVALAAARGVDRLLFGTIDFQLDMGIGGDDLELLHFRSHLVLASRLAGLPPPVDGVCKALDDPERLGRETRRARALGFGGKLVIHPRQVASVNAAFAPTAQEIAWARRVLSASASAQGAAVQLDGEMVDRPVLLEAQRILSQVNQGEGA